MKFSLDDVLLLSLLGQKKNNKTNNLRGSHTTNVIFFAAFIDNGTESFVRESDLHLAGFFKMLSHPSELTRGYLASNFAQFQTPYTTTIQLCGTRHKDLF